MKRIIVALSLAALAAPVFAAEVSAPFEQTQFDRGLPTRQDNANASGGSTREGTVWADDYNFIAPAQ
jgi:hypothetical protein